MSAKQMSRSERRSLYRFMAIYLLSTLLLYGIGAAIFYQFERLQMQAHARSVLKAESDRILPLIKQGKIEELSAVEGLDVAVYNGRKSYLFGTFQPAQVDWNEPFVQRGDRLRYSRVIPPPHRKHTAYMVIERPIDQSRIATLRRTILYTTLLVLLLVLLLGYFLGRLFVIAPMRERIEMLDRFVQDTTHELNTPISTILTNIEMLGILGRCKEQEELRRIEIASRTLSRLYEDLSYLKLNEEYQRQIVSLDLSALLQERLTYFSALIDAKALRVRSEIVPEVLREMDRGDAVRLFDNLLSNAVKYNERGGSIILRLDTERFEICDSGRGMDAQTLSRVFARFERGDESEGGFGIGLDIVAQVCRYYGFGIRVDAAPGEGTTVTVSFGGGETPGGRG